MPSSLEKSAGAIISALQEMLFAEDTSRRPGLLQRLGTRARILFLALLLVATLALRLEWLPGLFLFVLALAWASRLPMGTFLRRVGALAALTFFLALPSLFLVPGEAIAPGLPITIPGARATATLVLRAANSISLALLLAMTTPWPALLGLLRGVGPLYDLLSMSRRYIFLLLRRAEEMLLSRRSRLVGRLPVREGWKVAAGAAGALIAHTYQMSQEIALAVEARMCARAPEGQPGGERRPALAASRLRYVYPGGVVALDGVDLEVWPGEHLAVLGANGSGKSTLLKVLDGLYPPQEGEVRFYGRPLLPDEASARDFHRRVGLVFQDPDVQLFSPTVWEEVAFAPRQLGLSPEEVHQRVEGMLARLGLLHLAERPPYRLSEGEKRKVALASVLVHEPELLLLDEPTASLDPRSRTHLLDLLLEWGRQDGHTLVLCTHDLALAQALARRVVVLNRGQVLAQGRPEEILTDEVLLREANLI